MDNRPYKPLEIVVKANGGTKTLCPRILVSLDMPPGVRQVMACASIVRQVHDDAVWVNYDAGNVMDYLNLDPLADVRKCAAEVRSFCIKDHRNDPRDEDCGPGFGESDHYKLLATVAFTGRKMPLCCENIFPPLLPRPATAEGIDDYARRARLFLETVTAGLKINAS